MAQAFSNKQPSGFKNHIENVAIVGAGGQSGKHIAKALLEKGIFKVTAITREDSPNKPAEGIHIARVNYADPKTLVKALKGQNALIITMSVHSPSDQQDKLIHAAAEAGVPWVLPNEFGGDGTIKDAAYDTMIGEPKEKARELIHSLGVSKWIGIACSFWYEYSLSGPSLYGIDIEEKKVTWFDDGKQRIHATTWPQVGRSVAALLSLPIYPKDENDKSTTLSSYAEKFVRVASFTLNQHEMYESVKRVTGTKDSDWNFGTVSTKQRFEDSKKAMLEGGPRINFAHALYTRYFYPDNAGLYGNKPLDNEKLKLPKDDLDTFTKEAIRLSEQGYFKTLFGMK